MATVEQIKAARALLGWTQEDLAVRSTVSVPTVRRFEARSKLRVSDDIRLKMEAALQEIRSGELARDWLRETKSGRKRYAQLLAESQNHPMEKVGSRLRALMSWNAKKKPARRRDRK